MTPARSNADAGASQHSGRHKARRNAMMVLYQLDLLDGNVEAAIAAFEGEHGFELPQYARELVEAVTGQREQLDATLAAHLAEWSLERLGAVERAILRIAAAEIAGSDVPDEVAIDEAVELAKRYASPEAAKLVNGVLGGLVRGKEQ